MRFCAVVTISLSIACSVKASLLNTTEIKAVLADVTDPTSLTIPPDAMNAIKALGIGGENANKLGLTDVVAIVNCAEAARENTVTSDGKRGSQSNIAFKSNRLTLHACEMASQQVDAKGSDKVVTSLIEDVKELNVETDAAPKAKASKSSDAGKGAGDDKSSSSDSTASTRPLQSQTSDTESSDGKSSDSKSSDSKSSDSKSSDGKKSGGKSSGTKSSGAKSSGTKSSDSKSSDSTSSDIESSDTKSIESKSADSSSKDKRAMPFVA